MAIANEIDRRIFGRSHQSLGVRKIEDMRIVLILAAFIAVAAAAPKPDDDDDDSLRCRKVQVGVHHTIYTKNNNLIE